MNLVSSFEVRPGFSVHLGHMTEAISVFQLLYVNMSVVSIPIGLVYKSAQWYVSLVCSNI